jgi:excisionase family DNA binding protein
MVSRALKPLLTRREVADVLGVSVQTVARLIERGQLGTVRVGERLKRIPAEDLERYLRAEEKGGGE